MVEDDQSPTRTHPDLWNQAAERTRDGDQGTLKSGFPGERYDPHEVLGTGGMAEVWLARDTSLQRDVAIKLMKAQFLDDPDLVERFRREGVAAASINHPNVVPIYDVGTGGGVGYLVMEHVPGGTLTQLVKANGPLEPIAWIRLAREVLGALEAVHEAGILHRDIKPSNILFNHRGAAKVADFGIAHLDDARGLTGSMVVGTPTYLSPEILQGELATAASDLFALGRTLIFAATGNAKNPGLTGNFAPELHYWIDRMLAFETSSRFPSATMALQHLDAISRGEPTPTPAITQSMRAMPIGPYVTGNDVPTLADARPRGASGLPWAVAGLAVGALVAVLAFLLPSLRGTIEQTTGIAGPSETATTAAATATEASAPAAAPSSDAKPAEDAGKPDTSSAAQAATSDVKAEPAAAAASPAKKAPAKQNKAQAKKPAKAKKASAPPVESAPALVAAPPPASAALTISHKPVTRALVGTQFRLSARTDSPASKVSVLLKVGTLSWKRRAMSSNDGTNWSFSIEVAGKWVSGTSYYIVAEDGAGNSANSGSAGAPYTLKIR